ncbi:MAG: hypothetical protein EOO04_01095 [Chitinophagaceae bacterium]|nr:MAG: hypothetical protein EOO04_01095 [Chitinophagaceae bacterium]
MLSKNMRYIRSYPANEALQNSGLPEKAKSAFDQIASGSSNSIANRFALFDPAGIYFLMTHFLKLNASEVGLVLKAAIEKAKGHDGKFSEDDERKLHLIVAPVLDRSVELADAGKFIEAVEPVLVILTIIENEMDHVEDEGFNFQMLVEDCFNILKKIAEYNYNTDIAHQLKKLCFEYNNQRDEALSFYDDEWAEVSDQLSRL